MKILITQPTFASGMRHLDAGTVAEVSPEDAVAIIRAGRGVAADPSGKAAVREHAERERKAALKAAEAGPMPPARSDSSARAAMAVHRASRFAASIDVGDPRGVRLGTW
jgi:hypothetical protein